MQPGVPHCRASLAGLALRQEPPPVLLLPGTLRVERPMRLRSSDAAAEPPPGRAPPPPVLLLRPAAPEELAPAEVAAASAVRRVCA